jgi:hypothetical protein
MVLVEGMFGANCEAIIRLLAIRIAMITIHELLSTLIKIDPYT